MGKVMCVIFMDSSSVILVLVVPAGRTVKEAFAWKTISRSRGDPICYSNLNIVWFKEVYKKWVKRHQNRITLCRRILRKGVKRNDVTS